MFGQEGEAVLPETITSGGNTYAAVWLRARIKRSRKPDLFIAQLDVPGLVEPPTFYVDSAVVRMDEELEPGAQADGLLKAFLIARRPDGRLSVLVPGEAVSYGPQLLVPEELAA